VLLEKLGSGGLGEVWKARDQVLNRVVAMKFVAAAAGASGGSRELLKEARAASALNHPNIVTVFEVGESPHGAYMTMEVVEGETLREKMGRAKMSRGALSSSDIHDIASQVAEGLAVAHAHGIVHRDLKPENIMIRADGYVKVLDFGLAKTLPWAQEAAGGSATASVGTVTGHLAGTFSYMSPEQARAREVGPASDVFSFGIILYEMLAGAHPFRADSVMDTLHNIVSAEPPPLKEDLPASLAALVGRALEKDPSRRYADARILSEVLQTTGAVSVQAQLAPPVVAPKPVPASRFLWPPRWIRALGLLLSIALMVVAIAPDLTLASSARAGSAPQVQSVAVLAFHAPPGDAALDSFAADLSESLSDLLAKSGTQVSAQSAVAALAPAMAPQDAGHSLSVDAVFTGTMRVSGELVKIHVELVNSKNGFQIWSDTFVQRREVLPGSEQRIAEEIVSRVRSALSTMK
jgi:eukaryotic-like serine/threonine-protein kinase